MSLIAPAWRRSAFAVVALLGCLLGGLFVLSRGPDTSDASARHTSLHPGLGRRIGGDFVGFFVTGDGVKVYCLDPRDATPRRLSLHTVRRYPRLSATASNALAYALATWGGARSRDAAVVTSQVVNTLAGHRKDVARRARSLPVSLRRLTAARVRQARAMRGPYSVRVSAPIAALPGQSATGTARLVSAAGHAVAGAVVSLRGSGNATVPASVRTDRAGIASFRYRVTDVGKVRVTATTDRLPGTALRVSRPRPGEQRMATAGARVRASASATFRGTPTGLRHRYSCDSDCDGRPVVTLSACAPASLLASRAVFRIGTRAVAVAFAAASRIRCHDATLPIADGTAVGMSWQYRTTHGWSRSMAAGGSFVVDCPPAPALTITSEHDCTTARVAVRTVSSRRPTEIVVTGGRRATVTAAAGRHASWSVAAPCGAHLKLTVRSGVRRAGGGWNLGPAMSLTTP